MRRNSIAAMRMNAIDWATDRRKPLSSAVMQMSPRTVAPELSEAPFLWNWQVCLPYGITAPRATSYVSHPYALASARRELQHVGRRRERGAAPLQRPGSCNAGVPSTVRPAILDLHLPLR